MKTKAVRLYGVDDIRLDEFELPEIKDDEILVKVVSDSICMSTWKTVKQGANHKRVPNDVADHPIIIGHEFAGDIVQVGKKWQDTFQPGQKLFRDRWKVRDIPMRGAVAIRSTVSSRMISLKQDVFGHLKGTAISQAVWQSLSAV